MRRVLLCVDSEGGKEQIKRVLNILDEERIKATFFVVGENCERYPELYREISDGYQIENHTYSHPNLRRLSKSEQRKEILKGKEAIERITGKKVKGFRAPYHFLNKDTVEILNESGFAFDVSCLYFNYDLSRVIKIRPTWFAESTDNFSFVRLHWNFMKLLFTFKKNLIIPVHPQYTGRDGKGIKAFKSFIRYVKRREGVFIDFDELLEKR